jgi:hypothetical protein
MQTWLAKSMRSYKFASRSLGTFTWTPFVIDALAVLTI